jgi:hypothetical protein
MKIKQIAEMEMGWEREILRPKENYREKFKLLFK